jgi:hypothetical protein
MVSRLFLALTLDPLNGILKQLSSIGEVQFLLDVCTISLDCFYAQVELLCYLAGSVPLAD